MRGDCEAGQLVHDGLAPYLAQRLDLTEGERHPDQRRQHGEARQDVGAGPESGPASIDQQSQGGHRAGHRNGQHRSPVGCSCAFERRRLQGGGDEAEPCRGPTQVEQASGPVRARRHFRDVERVADGEGEQAGHQPPPHRAGTTADDRHGARDDHKQENIGGGVSQRHGDRRGGVLPAAGRQLEEERRGEGGAGQAGDHPVEPEAAMQRPHRAPQQEYDRDVGECIEGHEPCVRPRRIGDRVEVLVVRVVAGSRQQRGGQTGRQQPPRPSMGTIAEATQDEGRDHTRAEEPVQPTVERGREAGG